MEEHNMFLVIMIRCQAKFLKVILALLSVSESVSLWKERLG